MADSTTTTRTAYMDLTLTNGENVKTRRLSFEMHGNVTPVMLPPAMVEFRDSLVGGGLSTFIQPSGWKDDDTEEDEYKCTGFAAGYTLKEDTKFDLDEVE